MKKPSSKCFERAGQKQRVCMVLEITKQPNEKSMCKETCPPWCQCDDCKRQHSLASGNASASEVAEARMAWNMAEFVTFAAPIYKKPEWEQHVLKAKRIMADLEARYPELTPNIKADASRP